jgi:ribose-phosphate pyrophosphokinase
MSKKDNPLENVAIFSGNANKQLAKKICQHLGVKLKPALVKIFTDGENQIKIQDNIRRKEVYLIQPTCPPVDHNFMQLCIMIDALRRASAETITAVVPYFGYARQDKKTEPRVPISAKLAFDFIVTAGANRIITMDLHAVQCAGFVNIPVDNLYAEPAIVEYIKKNFSLDNLMLASTDVGGAARTRSYAKRLGVDIAVIDKRRPEPNKSEVMNIVGDVKNKIVILVDDIIDTAGTLVGGADAVKQAGALEVHAVCTHPVFSGPAINRITESVLSSIAVTNTIPLRAKAKACPKIKIVGVSWWIGEAIRRTHTGESLTDLFASS